VFARAQAAEVKNTLLCETIKSNTKLKNLQPLVCVFETSVVGVAFKDTNGDGQLTARASAPPAPAGCKPIASVYEPVLNNLSISLIAADGSLAASSVADSTGKCILRTQLVLGNYTLKSSLNPSIAMHVSLSNGSCADAFTVPIQATWRRCLTLMLKSRCWNAPAPATPSSRRRRTGCWWAAALRLALLLVWCWGCAEAAGCKAPRFVAAAE
jgi:hypothetical protein